MYPDKRSLPDELSRLPHQDLLNQLLNAHGIALLPPPEAAVKSPLWLNQAAEQRCLVLVIEQQAIRLRLLHTREDAATLLPAAVLRRLKRLAVRAVYAAGLDVAEVTLQQAGGSQVYAVERVDPKPVWQDTDLALARQAKGEINTAIRQYQEARSKIQLGMDPEFILMNSEGKIVPANRFLAKEGRAGYDNATVRGRMNVHPLVELRPAPSGDPGELIRNLRRAMWHAADRINDASLQWIAGGMPITGLPLGGHVHLSGVPLHNAIIRALDNYLALPLLMLEHASGRLRRKKYGKLGDVRAKSYGGFEYRTLPSMLVSPRITKGTVALAKLIALNYGQLRMRPLDQLDQLQAYYEGDKEKLKQTVDRIWLELTQLKDYGTYASYLDPLGEWIMLRKSWDETRDFRRVWRIPPYN